MQSFLAIATTLLSLASALPVDSLLNSNGLVNPNFVVPEGFRLITLSDTAILGPLNNVTDLAEIEALALSIKAELLPAGIEKRNNGDCDCPPGRCDVS
jgi:hypothetical protein